MHRALIPLLCLIGLASCANRPPDTAARNVQLLAQYYAHAGAGNFAAQAAMWAPAGINLGKPTNPEGIRVSIEDIHRTFPDYASVALETRAVGDTVVQLSRMSGTHRGVAQTAIFGGLLKDATPSGRRFEVLVTHWWRFDPSGKIVWHEVTRDDLGMYRQLGLVRDATPAAASPTAPASLVRAGVTERLTPHVWAIPDGSAPLVPNVGIVVGAKAVLVIDTGMGARNAQTVLAEVAKVGAGKPIYLVTTHVHPEHDMGAHAFPADSQLIRSRAQIADIAAGAGTNLVPVFAARSDLNRELLAGARHRDADIVFDQEYTLDLGGLQARIVSMGTNHTRGDTVVLVDGVLFSGDVAMKPQPSFANPAATLGHWLESLDRLEAMQASRIVPSHGPFGGGEIIAGYREYFTRIRDRAAQLRKAGKTQDEAVQAITEELSAQYPDRNRLGGAIRAAYSN